MLNFEKKCRLNNDMPSLKEICLAIVRLCHSLGNYPKLNASLLVLNKRRSQSKNAITAIVQEAMTYLVTCPSIDIKMELIKTLITVCTGKMYVEAEDARLHLILALIYETRDDIASACDMIQDVHVETYGSLSKTEKAGQIVFGLCCSLIANMLIMMTAIEYILQQIRLNLKRKDFIRTMIQSRKMNRKTIEQEGFNDVSCVNKTLLQ
jgi:26S proteasome regulatory subunit N5